MRVEAAASARFARSAPWVMLPASTIWRNRLRSVKSKRMGTGYHLIPRRQATQNTYCNAAFIGTSFAFVELAGFGSKSRPKTARRHERATQAGLFRRHASRA